LRQEMLAEADNSYLSAVEVELEVPQQGGDLFRVGEVAIYGVDALCRRSEVLQKTAHADNDFVGMNPDDAGSRGLEDGREVKVSQADGQLNLPLRICNELPVGAVWVKSATNAGKTLGDSFGPVSVEAV
jgi:NADH-quinone oxidoreductase subunit G